MAKGAQWEYQLRDKLLKADCYVARSAGSHGHDIIAIHPTGWHVLCEVKGTAKQVFYFSPEAKEQWRVSHELADKGFNVYWCIHYKGGDLRTRWQFFHINCSSRETKPLKRGYGEDWEAFLKYNKECKEISANDHRITS